jgi:hypothetical protein
LRRRETTEASNGKWDVYYKKGPNASEYYTTAILKI